MKNNYLVWNLKYYWYELYLYHFSLMSSNKTEAFPTCSLLSLTVQYRYSTFTYSTLEVFALSRTHYYKLN